LPPAVATINFRGVGESVKANVVLTCVELSGLLIIIAIGLWAIGLGQGDVVAPLRHDDVIWLSPLTSQSGCTAEIIRGPTLTRSGP
jgi:amino acid transporter